MKCSFCGDNVKEFELASKVHVCISKNKVDGQIHTHGDLASQENVKEMLEAAAEAAGVSLGGNGQDLPAEIVFHNRQRIGDMLMFTCGVRDFKAAFPHVRVNVIATAMHIFDHNPNIDRTLVATEKNTVKIGPGKLTNSSNRKDWHFANAYRVSMEDALGVHIEQGESRPDIYLTQEEYDAPRLIEKPYWIICTSGEKGWGCKMYPHVKWQEVVDQNPDLLFVQIGTKEDDAPRLQGANVLDYIGKTQSKDQGIRDLFKLFLNAEGSIGLVSFHMHLSGALHKPAVIIAGAREPVHFTRYQGHAYLSTEGMLPCGIKACWHCSIDTCTNLVMRPVHKPGSGFAVGDEKVPKCVDMIDAEEVTRAINGYYKGGRLVKGVPSAKPKFKNVVPTPPKPPVQNIIGLPQRDLNQGVEEPTEAFGMKFGGGALTGRDWLFIKSVIDQYGVKSCLEFGAGLSTLLLNDYVEGLVHTFETNQGWIDKIGAVLPCTIYPWNGTDVLSLQKYDLAFVDGPAGDIGREMSTRLGSENSDLVIVHDAGREWARKYQAKYLEPHFDGPVKGGHRCHLWVKKGKVRVPRETMSAEVAKGEIVETCSVKPCQNVVPNAGSKRIKIVSTARGWGGCARSVTTIMRRLLEAGHSVEFIPFRNAVSSREYLEILKGPLSRVKVTLDYSTVNEYCDVFLMYADDYVWEFGKPEMADTFIGINAERKIMMLNYRRGKVGEIPWTQSWNKYMFLNSTQEAELLKVLPGKATKVLPPCVDLDRFFAVRPNYDGMVRVVRHSSQGDTKFEPPDIVDEQINTILTRPDVSISFLPGPSLVPPQERFTKAPRTADPQVIANFLATGNLFWYSLPEGYMDMGPRVILEAMASGLPVIADNWGGAIDRITDDSGWICKSKQEQIAVMKTVNTITLRRKGEAARARARDNFAPEAWLRELLD